LRCGVAVPGREIEDEVRMGEVPRCRVCFGESGGNMTKKGTRKKKRKGKGKRKRSWDGDSSLDSGDEDGRYSIPEAGVMKVSRLFSSPLSSLFPFHVKTLQRKEAKARTELGSI
jgi:hypothetical protein